MLEKSPKKRPSSMEEVVETIKGIDLFLDEKDEYKAAGGN
jgi:hypothetical protein